MSALVFALLGVAAFLTPDPQLWTAMFMCVLGLWMFVTHGRHQVTAAGLWGLSGTVFIGYAGIVWSIEGVDVTAATLIATWSTFAMWVLWWRRDADRFAPIAAAPPAVTLWGMTSGVTIAVIGVVVAQEVPGVGSFVILGGLSMFLVAMAMHRGRVGFWRAAVALAVVGIYWQTSFSGFGRLLLVALGLTAIVSASARWRSAWSKIPVVAVAAAAIPLLIWQRERFGLAKYGRESDGQGSIVNPLADFDALLGLLSHGTLQHGDGHTFFATAVLWVPRSIWPDKPDGFGAELTEILAPTLAGTGYSKAAQSAGEWYYNFGAVGLVAMVLVLGFAVRWLDRQLAGLLAEGVTSRRQLARWTLLVVAVASIPTLLWVGTFTFVSRFLQQGLVPWLMVRPFASAQDRRAALDAREDEPVGAVSPVGRALPLRKRV